MAFCSACGTQNRDGSKFCRSCGTALELGCANCGAPLEVGDEFCVECGTPVATGTAPAPQAKPSTGPEGRIQPVAERRLVSVLFVDLVGFTNYSDGRDPEDVRGMLSRYFEKAEEIIGLYGGVVEKFIGDAVMAVWGTPIAREDDAGRAVRAALELVDAVEELGRTVDADLKARAGIYSGEAAVNLAAKGQGMVAGDTVNTASRLQSSADPGSVLVDRATYLAARDAIAFEAAGHLMLKGKEEPVEAWRPTRVVAGLGGFRFADSLEPAFTGRDEEFRQIKDLLHASARERKPRLASVMGVGGIGKSRLVWELFKYIDGLSDLIFWHQGRSPSYGEGVAFWALAEMVRMRARIAETDDDAAALVKLDECIDEYFPDEEDATWVRPHLQQLIGLGDGTEAAREQLFSAWRTLFERIGELGPVIMIFEDLHWADSGLIDFIEHLMSSTRNSPILIVTLARPELMDKRPTWGAGQRNFISIHLEPLGTDDMTLLLKSSVGDLPTSVREEIIERAEGVPLYAVEMVRMLVDRQNLVEDGDGYRWVGGDDHVGVPDSLHSLIASRLDSLPTEDRMLVQDASVLGKTFTVPCLAAVSAKSAEELDPHLSDLARREIFLVDNDPRSPERGQYGFVQSLIREIAYQTLSNSNRKDRHLAAARFFEGEPDLIDVVATHYVEAYNNSSKDNDEAAALAESAREALVEAAERAQSLGSVAQSLTLLEKALRITDAERERGKLLFLAGKSATKMAQTDKGIDYLLQASELLRADGNRQVLAEAQAQLGLAYFLASRLDEAENMLEAAVNELEDQTSPEAATLFTELARICMFKGKYDKCELYTNLAMPAAEKAEKVGLVADALITRAVGSLFSGRTHEARALLTGALALAEEHGLVSEQLRALINISANEGQVDPRAALEAAQRGMEIAQRAGDIEGRSFLIGNGCEAAIHLARWDWIREQTVYVNETATDEFVHTALGPLVLAAAYVGDLDEARRRLALFEDHVMDSSALQEHDAVALAKCTIAFVEGDLDVAQEAIGANEFGSVTAAAPFGIVGRVALWRKDLRRAEQALAEEERSTLRNPWQRCRMKTLQAGIAALKGGGDLAIALYAEAFEMWSTVENPLGSAMCQMDLALLVAGPKAAEAAAEAEAFFTEAGNGYFVKRLQEARAS